MKTLYISFFVVILFVLAISTDAEKEEDCPKFCTFDYKPVCGYNGRCYRKYGNACTLKVEQCSSNENKKILKAVDMDLCVKALAKSNPDIIACDEEQDQEQ